MARTGLAASSLASTEGVPPSAAVWLRAAAAAWHASAICPTASRLAPPAGPAMTFSKIQRCTLRMHALSGSVHLATWSTICSELAKDAVRMTNATMSAAEKYGEYLRAARPS